MISRPAVRSSILLLALAFAPSVARAQIEEPRIPLQTKLDEVNRFRAEYAEDYNKKDMAAVVAMYAPDAIVIGADGATIVGIDQIRAALTKDPQNSPHLVITSDSLAIYGNTAVDVGTTKAHPAAGGEQVSRYLVVLRRDMHGWKLVRLSTTPVNANAGM